ncbi:MAG: hypothetical protein QNJ41_23035 [Xenococcaceae cyanobacterium MO_188.B32]|nr:hypothetical protein [Xenococcaceae cyanobacterium MO_188.B32]
MLVEPEEAIAGLKVLICMAKADGKLHPEEKKILTEAWQKAQQLSDLPENVTIDSLFAEDITIEEILPQIKTPKTQKILYKVAYFLAEIDGVTPAERIILDKIEASFQSLERDLLSENDSLAELALKSPHDFIEAIAAQLVSVKEVRDLILDYAIGIAILGFNPFPGINLVTNTIACGLILKMISDIGAKYGYPKGQDAIAIIGSIFGGFGAFLAALTSWATISFLGLYIPVMGEFAAASFLFTLTWAIGQATNQFYLSGRQLNAAALKQAFLQAQREGKILSKNINFKDSNFKSRSRS